MGSGTSGNPPLHINILYCIYKRSLSLSSILFSSLSLSLSLSKVNDALLETLRYLRCSYNCSHHSDDDYVVFLFKFTNIICYYLP